MVFDRASSPECSAGTSVVMLVSHVWFQLKDLAFFIAILLVVLLAYGVASQALLYPNSEATWYLLKDIVYKPYWQMYGELFLDELEGKTTFWHYFPFLALLWG